MLALACQVDGLVALDHRLRPLRPAIIWLDRRATCQSARLSEAVGEAELIARTGLNGRAGPPGQRGCAVPADPVRRHRAPLERPHGGSFAGLGLHHDQAHLARAILEGCAFALRDIVDRFDAMGLGGQELRVVGGGARSALWLQIKADVTGRPVRAVRGDHATSAGAAMLAGVAAGFFADLGEAAARVVRMANQPVCPRAATAAVYDEGYHAYRRLFDGIERALS